MSNTLLRSIFAIVATVAILFVFVKSTDVHEIFSVITKADPYWIVYAVLGVVFTTCLRALRVSLFVSDKIDFLVLLTSIIHNAATALLPMKLGELALPALLSYIGRMTKLEALGAFFVLRIADLIALALLVFLAVAIAFQLHNSAIAAIGLFALVSTTAALCVLFAYWDAVIASLKQSFQTQSRPRLEKLLQSLTRIDRFEFVIMLTISVAIWLSLSAVFYFSFRSLNIQPHPAEVVFIGGSASLAFAAPIAGVANIGPFQAAWLWASMLFQKDATTYLAAGILAHGSVVIVISTLGAIAGVTLALVTTGRSPPKKQ